MTDRIAFGPHIRIESENWDKIFNHSLLLQFSNSLIRINLDLDPKYGSNRFQTWHQFLQGLIEKRPIFHPKILHG